jgi:hypothetical protein
VQGASGVGFGNFNEVGPLTVDLKPRSTTWLSVAHLLFVVLTPSTLLSQKISSFSSLLFLAYLKLVWFGDIFIGFV